MTSGKNLLPELKGSGKIIFLHTFVVLTSGKEGGEFT